MAAHINSALADEMLRRPEILIFGEDVQVHGGHQAVRPEDIADTVLFLASERASFLTGQTISVSGGYSMW